MSSGIKASFVGSVANQRYEASRNAERHAKLIYNTSPSTETIRWRDTDPYIFSKQEDQLILDEKKLNQENQLISDRLINIAAENRLLNAHELAPGWKAGPGTDWHIHI
jgi:hypothetical protein